jgi:hypothetical protein
MNIWPVAIVMAIFCLGVAIFTRNQRGNETIVQAIFAILTPIIVVGFGSVMQTAVQGLISPAANQEGLIYQFASAPLQSLINDLSTILIAGPLPGGIIGLLLLRTRAGASWVAACVTATVILALSDLLDAAVPGIILGKYGLMDGLRSLPFPIMCDFCGGFISGIVILLSQAIIMRRREFPQGHTGPAAFLASVGGAAILFTVAAIVVFYPIPDRISLSLKSYHDLSLGYGVNPNLAFAANPQELLLVPANVRISSGFGAIVVDATNNARKPTSLKVVELAGCRSPEGAIAAAQNAPGQILAFPPGKTTLSLGGFQPYLWLRRTSDPGEKNILTFRTSSLVQIYPRSDGTGRTFIFGDHSNLSIFGLGATTLIFNTTPVGPKNATGFNTSLEKGQPDQPSSSVPCQSNAKVPAPTSDGRVWYVVYASDSNARISGQIDLTNTNIDLPYQFGITNPLPDTFHLSQYINFLSGQLDDGALTVGTDRRPISVGDNVLLSAVNSFAIQDGPAGTIEINGQASYVAMNGSILNQSLFGRLPDLIQDTFITAVLGCIGWLCRRAFKRAFRRIYSPLDA